MSGRCLYLISVDLAFATEDLIELKNKVVVFVSVLAQSNIKLYSLALNDIKES